MADDNELLSVPDKPEMLTIKIEKDQERVSGGKVRVMTNGEQATFAAGQEITVPDYHVETLRNSNIYFEVVDGDDRASNPSTAPLTDTATRERPNVDPLVSNGDGEAKPVPQLENGEPDGAPAIGGAVQAATEYDNQLAAANADGQGDGATEATDTASRGAGGETGGGEPTGNQPKSEEPAEPGPLDASINDLKDYLDTIDDVSQIDALIKQEKGGKSRVGAMSALEARKAALSN